MNKDKMQQYADELTDDMAKAILSKDQRFKREVLAGAIAASANIMVIATSRLTKDVSESTEIISLAIAGAYKIVHNTEEQIKKGGISE